MSQMLLPTSRYTAKGKRSPGAMAAAIAVNGGVIALLLALPAAQVVIETINGPTTVRFIELPPPPPEVTDEPKADIKPIPTPDKDFVRNDPVTPDPILPLDTIGPIIAGTTDITPKGKDFVMPEKPVEPARIPVLTGARLDPRFTADFKPDYPAAMRREGLEGSVTVRVTIDEKGRVIAVDQVRATDPAFFDAARRQALRYWRFIPAKEDGRAIQSQQTLTLQFRLEE